MSKNLYSWESATVQKFQSRGNMALTGLLLASAAVIILIALFSKSTIFKSLVLAYVILP